jgi:hypothetical protein
MLKYGFGTGLEMYLLEIKNNILKAVSKKTLV